MRIYAANSVFIEVTRRCNMCCAHCLRGDAESIDIQEKYIDAFLDSFEKGAYISSLTFTGGEISLNIPAIRYTLKAVKERGIAVGSFYMVTNGKAVDKMANLAMASLEWWNYCDDKDDYSCGLCISSDDFHEAIPYESKSILSGLKYNRNDKVTDFHRACLLNEGRAKNLDSNIYKKREPNVDKLEYEFSKTGGITINDRKYRYFDSRPLKGKVKTLTVKRDNLGDIYIFVVTQEECNEILPRAGKAVGMDFGLKHFLNLDDGSVIDSPEWYKASLKELQRVQRHISRCKPGSNNRKKAIKELNRIYRKICNQRTDWFFKLAYQLIADYAIICIEDLNLNGMQKLWGRKINDIAVGEFVQILEWAASNCGTEVVKIDHFAPSSKCCSRCGYIYRELTLKQRRWDCPSCGTHHERDVNAAINICRMGLVQMGYPA